MSEQYINPFDEPKNQFIVLINSKNQHSLWPDFKSVPSGWELVFGPQVKQKCIDYIEENWHDIRV